MLSINLGDTVSFSYDTSWESSDSHMTETEVFSKLRSFDNLSQATGYPIKNKDEISRALGQYLFKCLKDSDSKDIEALFTNRVLAFVKDLSKILSIDTPRITFTGPNIQHLNLKRLCQEKIEFLVKFSIQKSAAFSTVIIFKGDNHVEVRQEGKPAANTLAKLIGEKTPLPNLTQATGVNSKGESDLNYLIGPSYFKWAKTQGWNESKIILGHEERVEALRKDLNQLGVNVAIPKPLDEIVFLTPSGKVVVTSKSSNCNLREVIGPYTPLPNLSKATAVQSQGDSDLNYLLGEGYFHWAAGQKWNIAKIIEGHKARVEALQKDLELTGIRISNEVNYENLYKIKGQQAVVAYLKSGMGNQMFQAASGYAMAKDRNMAFYAVQEKGIDHQKGIPEVLKRVPIKDIDSLPPIPRVRAWGRNPDKAELSGGSFMIEGHLQHYPHFEHHRKDILELFGPSKETEARLKALYPQVGHKKSIAIHVRRGDYLKLDHLGRLYYHNLLDEWKYYEQALEILGVEDAEVLIFSDDIAYCKDHSAFKNLKKVTFVDKTKSASDDMYLMSFCKHQIISNGTFAVWGAYLNDQKERQIFYPNKWIGPAWNEGAVKDICPAYWTEIVCQKR